MQNILNFILLSLSDILDFINKYNNLILATITLGYVELTRRLLKESKEANALNREVNEKQFQLLTLPHMYCNVHRASERVFLTIYNSGNLPAYDVDIMVIGRYYEDDIDTDTDISNYVKPKNNILKNTPNDDGEYGIFDHIVYPCFPNRKSVSTVLDFSPIVIDSVSIILQYRDTIGNNYCQYLWFFASFNYAESSYRLGALEPIQIVPSPRILYELGGNLVTENGQNLPQYLTDFSNMLKHITTCGYTTDTIPDVEDRGEWKDI